MGFFELRSCANWLSTSLTRMVLSVARFHRVSRDKANLVLLCTEPKKGASGDMTISAGQIVDMRLACRKSIESREDVDILPLS
jgi:hypothetical protein